MMDFAEFSQQTAEQINQELRKLLNEWRREVQKTTLVLLPLADKFIKACEGGKRLRGVLVVLGYEIARNRDHPGGVMASRAQPATIRGGLDRKAILKVAAAYEIIHTALLVHDDVMDQSPLRRGKPSLYMALGGGHYGISQAINLGDVGFFLASRIILKTLFDDRQKMKALEWFYQIMLDTAAGQMLDIDGRDPMIVAKLKTARYSLTGPLVLGTILAGNELKLVKYLKEFGDNLGIAFQIKDDILDGEDHRWGGLDAAKKAAEKYKNLALKVLPEITKNNKMSKLLEQMAEYLVQRKK